LYGWTEDAGPENAGLQKHVASREDRFLTAAFAVTACWLAMT